MALYYINHITKHSYSGYVTDGATEIRLYPINNEFQKVISHNILVSNNPNIHTFEDFYANTVGSFMLVQPHDILYIESNIEVLTQPTTLPTDKETSRKQWNLLESLKNDPMFMDFLRAVNFDGTPLIKDMVGKLDVTKLTPYQLALHFNEYMYSNFKYFQGVTQVDSKLDHVWNIKAGVCQDFTSILLQITRTAGIPSRYVSGYICPGNGNTRGEGATHAWVEVYIPFYGWLGLDPTNNSIASEQHIKLAIGKNYNDCAPVKGVYKGKVTDHLYVQVHISAVKNYDLEAYGDIQEAGVDVTNYKTEKNSYREHLQFMQQQQ